MTHRDLSTTTSYCLKVTLVWTTYSIRILTHNKISIDRFIYKNFHCEILFVDRHEICKLGTMTKPTLC